jgi:hypothetical protein
MWIADFSSCTGHAIPKPLLHTLVLCFGGADLRITTVTVMRHNKKPMNKLVIISVPLWPWLYSQAWESVPAWAALHCVSVVLFLGPSCLGQEWPSQGHDQGTSKQANSIKKAIFSHRCVKSQMTTAKSSGGAYGCGSWWVILPLLGGREGMEGGLGTLV